MNRSQSKYFNTARRMDNALVSLLAEKDLQFVTVKEICDRAGVSRSTFYLHYGTIGDLLDECLDAVVSEWVGRGCADDVHHVADIISACSLPRDVRGA